MQTQVNESYRFAEGQHVRWFVPWSGYAGEGIVSYCFPDFGDPHYPVYGVATHGAVVEIDERYIEDGSYERE